MKKLISLIAILTLSLFNVSFANSTAKDLYNQGNKYLEQQDYQTALKYFKESAEKGYPNAQSNIGVMYHIGQGVEPNEEEAIKWYSKAAKQGFAEAQHNLGNIYFSRKNYNKAIRLFKKAANQGFAGSQFMLGQLYLNGVGVKESQSKAIMWMKKAARNGVEKAQKLLKDNGIKY